MSSTYHAVAPSASYSPGTVPATPAHPHADRELRRTFNDPVLPTIPESAPTHTRLPLSTIEDTLPDESPAISVTTTLWRKPVFIVSVAITVAAIAATVTLLILNNLRAQEEVIAITNVELSVNEATAITDARWKGPAVIYQLWWLSEDAPVDVTAYARTAGNTKVAYLPQAEVSGDGCLVIMGYSGEAPPALPRLESTLNTFGAVTCTGTATYSQVEKK